MEIKEKFVTDADGNRISVLPDIKDYEELLEALEDAEAIRAFDEDMKNGEVAVPFDEAMERLKRRSA